LRGDEVVFQCQITPEELDLIAEGHLPKQGAGIVQNLDR
jgi:hypothetical protein